MAIFRRGSPILGAKIEIFDQYLALGSMTDVVASVVNNVDRGLKL